jgi:hypothetical protein
MNPLKRAAIVGLALTGLALHGCAVLDWARRHIVLEPQQNQTCSVGQAFDEVLEDLLDE